MSNADSPSDSVMARKIAPRPDLTDLTDLPGGQSTLRAMRLALARASSEELSLPMSVIGVRQGRIGQGDLGDCLDPGWLGLLLVGPDQAAGAVCLDRALVTAIIQHQTMGQILPGTDETRQFTATDAAMAVPLFDAMLERLDGLLEEPQDQQDLLGYAFATRADGPGELLLSLSCEWYRQFNLTVELGGGVCQGQMLLLLPESTPLEGATGLDMLSGPSLEDTASVIRADLTAVLCRIQLTLSEFSQLQVGDVVPLSGKAFDQTELMSITGEHVALCRLGQMNGMRAVRANEMLMIEDPIPDGTTAFIPANSEQIDAVVPDGQAPAIAEPVAPLTDVEGFVEPSADDIMSPEELEAELARLTDIGDPETLPALR